MSDPRASDILFALRGVLAGVSNLPVVAYAGQPYVPTQGVAYIQEMFSGGRAMDVARGGVLTDRWRQIDGNYTLLCNGPEDAGVEVVLQVAGAIESAMLQPGLTTASGWPLLITDTTIQTTRAEPNWLKVPLVLMFRMTYNA